MAKKSHKSNKRTSTTSSAAFRKLYDLALHIRTLKPWEYFSSGDFFIQFPKFSDRMIVACTVDTPAYGFGILVYPNPAFFPEYLLAVNPTNLTERDHIESEAYALFFDPWEVLPPSAQKLLASIGVRSGKADLYPWFSHKIFGHPEADLFPADYPILSDILANLIMQYRSILEQQLNVDFEGGQVLIRMYHPKDALWYNFASHMDLPPKTPVVIEMREDSPKLAHLRNCPVSTEISRVEFDYGWDPEPVLDEKHKAPYFQMHILLADRISGEILTYYTCHPNDFMDAAFSAFAELI
ncbi:MAG: hypothetical protein ACI4OI_06215, partial [Gemmiger sp.]